MLTTRYTDRGFSIEIDSQAERVEVVFDENKVNVDAYGARAGVVCGSYIGLLHDSFPKKARLVRPVYLDLTDFLSVNIFE
jgi:hypothetical protein